MAVIVANVAADPMDIFNYFHGFNLEQSGKSTIPGGVRITLAPNQYVDFVGNFQLDPIYNLLPIAGTLTSIKAMKDGAVQYLVTGLTLDVHTVYKYTSPIPGAGQEYKLAPIALAGNDIATGSNFVDKLEGYNGHDKVNGRGGNDVINGMDGNDTLSGDAGNDVVQGGNGNDTLKGGVGSDRLSGGANTDSLFGDANNDTLDGGAGNDILVGGLGKDTQIGGLGNDTFRFTAVSDSPAGVNADIIKDFDKSGNDIINLSALFGPTMTYRGAAAFTAAGQVRINDIGGVDLLVEVNTGGTLAADVQIRLAATTLASMTLTDFIL